MPSLLAQFTLHLFSHIWCVFYLVIMVVHRVEQECRPCTFRKTLLRSVHSRDFREESPEIIKALYIVPASAEVWELKLLKLIFG